MQYIVHKVEQLPLAFQIFLGLVLGKVGLVLIAVILAGALCLAQGADCTWSWDSVMQYDSLCPGMPLRLSQ